MSKVQIVRFIAPLFVFLLVLTGAVSAADLPLPASAWYAVTWEEASDTLHWINANGEQASIARPKLEGQISQTQTRLHISPDGRYLVVISPLLNGREGIGFYNFQTGQFAQIHESQPNEVFLPAGPHPFTEFSTHFVVPLRNNSTGDWRMIAFESATGNVAGVINRSDAGMPQGFVTSTAWWPSVVNFNVDEALNTLEVYFQLVTAPDATPASFPSYLWRIPPGNQPTSVSNGSIPYNPAAGIDVHPMTGELVYAWFDPQHGVPMSPAAANTISLQVGGQPSNAIASQSGGNASLPRWLKNGEWVGYWREDGVHAPHWMITPDLPIGPNYISVYHTPDGFLAKDSTAWRLDHGTTQAIEGFSDPIGPTIYQPGLSFAVVYTTPANTPFTLPSVAEPFVAPDGPDDLQAAPTQTVECPGAPAPRLTIGAGARVTFTDGSPLNLRTEPAGNFLTQIPEGTPMLVLAGPVCGEGYLYWQVQVNPQLVAWAAEGAAPAFYFLEPYEGGVAPQNDLPLAPVPTQVPPVNPGLDLDIAAQPTPVPPVQLDLDIVAQPTQRPGLDLVAVPVCPQSPTQRLQVGMQATTVQPSGTLALRTNLTDEFPSHQVPAGLAVNVLAGPQCRDGIRMWQVQVSLNGQPVTGWIAEGFQQTYYLQPN